MAAEVKYVSGPHGKRDENNRGVVALAFYVQVGQSPSLREVVMTRQQAIRFVQAAMANLPALIGAELEHAAQTKEYKL